MGYFFSFHTFSRLFMRYFLRILLVFTHFIRYYLIMINMIKDKPVRAEVYKEILDRDAQIRDLLTEMEQLLSFAINEDKVLLKASEVAEILRCDIKHIPKAIPRIRRSGESLFLKSDVYGYIDSKLKKAY